MELVENKTEKKLLDFSKELFRKIQRDTECANEFVKEAALCMLVAHEFGGDFYYNEKMHELLLMINLSQYDYKNSENKKDFFDHLDNMEGPFNVLNTDYYQNIFKENIFFLSQLRMMLTMSNKIQNKDELTQELLRVKSPDFFMSYDSFGKMQEIIRVGWIMRNVLEKYRENDSAHIMQMCAMASACINQYGFDDLNKQKLFEMMLIHEIGEILAGDKSAISAEHDLQYERERQGVISTFSKLKSGEYFISLWEEFGQRKTKEAKYAYEHDKLDPILKASYLDEELGRDDLFNDFYAFEEGRKTFEQGRLKQLFKYMKYSNKH